jgi:DNA-binding IclR family transcriptional regulator
VPVRTTNSNGSKTDAAPRRVPAVRNAIAVLRHLHATDSSPATMTEIASALGMNRSTCFTLLKVLAEEGFLTYEDDAKTYRLGPQLIELASAVDDHGNITRISMTYVRRLARELRLSVALVRMTGSEDFVVLDKEDSPEPFRVTLAIGERFPGNSAVLAKAYFAWLDEEAVDRLIERMGLPPRTPSTITDPKRFKTELALVRERGYATSVGEYYPGKNTLAAPIFDRYGQVSHLLLVVALAEDLPQERMEACGELLRETAASVTSEIGGRPADSPGAPGPAVESKA